MNSGNGIDALFSYGGRTVETVRTDWSYYLKFKHPETAVMFDEYYVDCPHRIDEFGCNRIVEGMDRTQFDWRVLDDRDRFVHSGKRHNGAMDEVRYRRAADAP